MLLMGNTRTDLRDVFSVTQTNCAMKSAFGRLRHLKLCP